MDIIAISAIVSTTVSSLVVFIAKELFQSVIQRRLQLEMENLKAQNLLEIEQLKSQLSLANSAELQVVSRRLQAYSRISSLVYRTRNMCRDLATNAAAPNVSLVEELTIRATDLKEILIEFRYDLERDNLFIPVHSYKWLVYGFLEKMADVKAARESGAAPRAGSLEPDLELKASFEELNKLHHQVVKALSEAGVQRAGLEERIGSTRV